MAITFRDALNGMAQQLPQLINSYFQFKQLEMDAMRTKSIAEYYGTQKELTEFEMEEARKFAPLKLQTMENEAELQRLLLDKEKVMRDAMNDYPGGARKYYLDEANAKINKLNQDIKTSNAQESLALTQETNEGLRLIRENELFRLQEITFKTDIFQTISGMFENPEVADEIFRKLPKNYTFEDLMRGIGQVDATRISPEDKKMWYDSIGRVNEMVTEFTRNKEMMIMQTIMEATNPTSPLYESRRAEFGIKKGDNYSVISQKIRDAISPSFDFTTPVNQIMESLDAINKVRRFHYEGVFDEKVEEEPQGSIYDKTNWSYDGRISLKSPTYGEMNINLPRMTPEQKAKDVKLRKNMSKFYENY